MTIAHFARQVLLGLTLSIIGVSAASASPLKLATAQKVETTQVQPVDYYHRHGYNDCYRPHYRDYRSHYYGRDYYRPYRSYSNYDSDYRDYSSYRYYRPRNRYYRDYDY